MKHFLMKKMMVNCRQATLLMAKKEEKKISVSERIKLFIHSAMCAFCKKFQKQVHHIVKESREIRSSEVLPEIAKERIERLISEHNG